MSALEIKSYVMPNDETTHCVNARDLWKSLKSKRQFANWIKDKLNYTQAEENVDYFLFSKENIFDFSSSQNQCKHCNNEVFNKSVKNLKGGRPTTNFMLTIDLAKEMAMLERNGIGKSIRTYLIDFEKNAIKSFNKKIDELKKAISISQELIACQERRIELIEKQLRAATILDEKKKLEIEINELKRQGFLGL